jgi:hypothetical protein
LSGALIASLSNLHKRARGSREFPGKHVFRHRLAFPAVRQAQKPRELLNGRVLRESLKAIGDNILPRGKLPRNGPGLISKPEQAVRIAFEVGRVPREELSEKRDIVSRECEERK